MNVFIIGARGYKTPYGGWETFVRGLLDNWKNKNIHFYVYEKASLDLNEKIEEISSHITLFNIHVPNKGGFTMMKYDAICTNHAYAFVNNNKITNVIFYYLGLRIGPYVLLKRRKFKKQNIEIYENAAGLEWRRTKWNRLVQLYLLISAFMMAKASDILICDSEGILDVYNKFLRSNRPKKVFIPYGTYINPKIVRQENVEEYYTKNGIKEKNYYLVVSRFVPENNYELIINEFMKSSTTKDLILVTNHVFENNYYIKLLKKLNFDTDKRIKFVGTLYDRQIMNNLRKDAFAYINGHTLGGTNPGLLEAMSITDLNLVYDVVFARQVGEKSVIYYDENNSLKNQIEYVEKLSQHEINQYGISAKARMEKFYEWSIIVDKYEQLFLNKE